MKFRFHKWRAELKNNLVEVSFQSLFFFQKWFLKQIRNRKDIYWGRRQRVQRSRLSQSILNLCEELGISLLNGRGTAERNILIYKKEGMGQIEILSGQVLKSILKGITGSVWQNDVVQFLHVWQSAQSLELTVEHKKYSQVWSGEKEEFCVGGGAVATASFTGVSVYPLVQLLCPKEVFVTQN